jgi:hypothetical protein
VHLDVPDSWLNWTENFRRARVSRTESLIPKERTFLDVLSLLVAKFIGV